MQKNAIENIAKKLKISGRGQAMPAQVQQFGGEAFTAISHTEIRWMGSAGVMINTRGTNIMIDPLLEGFDMPLLFEPPIKPESVPALDAILVTHIDNDHFSRATCRDLKKVCRSYHAPQYVAQVMREEGLEGSGHDIHDTFCVGGVNITLTPAEHNWQNEDAAQNYREWKLKDYCGFWLDTLDGSIWMPGDSRLLEEHLNMPCPPDVILMDFADNSWHITFDGAVKLADAYPNAEIICIHWGTVDAPDWNTFNGDPVHLAQNIVNPERVHALWPGEAYILKERVRKNK
ncbi:MAG: MBL fold metallo-hydrolase [Clostridium sp.]|nr:MBL fold metallo-hydrolase [Clostridium sp.]